MLSSLSSFLDLQNLGIDTQITSLGQVFHDLWPFLGNGGHLGLQNGRHLKYHLEHMDATILYDVFTSCSTHPTSLNIVLDGLSYLYTVNSLHFR